MTNTPHRNANISKERAANIILHVGPRTRPPTGISRARWNAIVKQLLANELKGIR